MKAILQLTLLIVLVFSITGCTEKECPVPPEPEIVTEYVYVYKTLPVLPKKPEPSKYELLQVNFYGVDYYVLSLNDGAKMSANWEAYKDWSESLYEILKNMENNATK